jgi:hypothetical protein
VGHFPVSGGGGGGGSIDEITSDDDSVTITDPTGPTTDLSVTSVQSVQWVDLGLIDLVSAMMDGPTTLYDMPDGTFLASIRFTDDPDAVLPDFYNFANSSFYLWPAIGTEKSFGWSGFAGLGLPIATISASGVVAYDSGTLTGLNNSDPPPAYGPFAALDTGTADFIALVLSAAAVGPIQVGFLLQNSLLGDNGAGAGMRVAPIAPWAADTAYDDATTNTVATPGVLKNAVISAAGTLWVNSGTAGTSGGTAPDFADNIGGSVADGDDIVWYSLVAPGPGIPTVGAVHAVAEIVTLVTP